VLDPGILNITTLAGATNLESHPSIAFDGTNYLVVWDDSRNGASNSDIFGTRVSPAGTVLDGTATGIPISTAATNQSLPALAFDGTNYLVVWQDLRNGASNTDIFGTRVSPAGAVLDGASTGFPISTATNAQFQPELAYNGTNYLVTWADQRTDPSIDIFGTRVSPAATVLDGLTTGIPISTAPQEQSGQSVAFNGVFLVVWRDRRSGQGFDLYGARVANNGTVTDASGFVVSAKPPNETGGAVITGPGDDWTSFYSRFEAVSNVTQIFSRAVSPK
jgi:hypothetical protein